MRLLLAAAVLAAGAFSGTAHADGPGYAGGCFVQSFNGPAEVFGDSPQALVSLAVAAQYPNVGARVAAQCEFLVNGVSQGIVLDAGSGIEVVAGAGRFPFYYTADDVLTICDLVTIGDQPTTRVCKNLTEKPICPDLVCGAGGVIDQAYAAAWPVLAAPDPVVCPELMALAGEVDSRPTSDYLYVDPATGDTYVGGTTENDLFWDCPPYTGTGS